MTGEGKDRKRRELKTKRRDNRATTTSLFLAGATTLQLSTPFVPAPKEDQAIENMDVDDEKEDGKADEDEDEGKAMLNAIEGMITAAVGESMPGEGGSAVPLAQEELDLRGTPESFTISIHDRFQPLEQWVNLLPGSDRIALDSHPYFAFADQLDASPLAQQVQRPCTRWAARFNCTIDGCGFAAAGEWSLAFNESSLYLNGANSEYRYDGTLSTYKGTRIGSCEPWLDSTDWTDEVKESLKTFVMASMDAMQNYFFWTWKIGPSLASGKVNSPLWSYKLGLDNGWIPTDPREAAGQCGGTNPRSGALKPSQTSYVSQTIAAALRSSHPFPPRATLLLSSPTLPPEPRLPCLLRRILLRLFRLGAVGLAEMVDGKATTFPSRAARIPILGMQLARRFLLAARTAGGWFVSRGSLPRP